MTQKPSQATILIPLPLFYNPDEKGNRRQIEEEKYLATAEELSQKFGGGVLHRFHNAPPEGYWWGKGVLSRDHLCVFEADISDTEENRRWLISYAKVILLKRFHQDAIFLKFISPVESLEVTEETVEENS